MRKRNLPTSDAALRICGIFRRSANTEWSDKEITAFKSIGKIESYELALVEQFYAKNRHNEKAFLRTGLQAFCNNFRGEVDKARQWAARNPKQAAPPSSSNGQEEPAGFMDWFRAEHPQNTALTFAEIPNYVKAEFRRSKT